MVTDALSRKYVFISTLFSKLIGFEYLKTLYTENPKFVQIIKDCEEWNREIWLKDRIPTPYSKFNSFLFKEKMLFVPSSSWREFVFKETPNGGMMGHF